jgi:hypothetical protein
LPDRRPRTVSLRFCRRAPCNVGEERRGPGHVMDPVQMIVAASSRRRRTDAPVSLTLLLASTLMAGCYSVSDWNRDKNRLIGMEFKDVASCAGMPQKQMQTGQNERSVEYSAHAQRRGFVWDCTVTLSLKEDRVVRVVDEVQNGGTRSILYCAQIFEDCTGN